MFHSNKGRIFTDPLCLQDRQRLDLRIEGVGTWELGEQELLESPT